MQKIIEESPAVASIDPKELEARDARGKRMAEMIQKHIAMASSGPKECVASLVDAIDETEELCYIDDDAPLVTKDQESSALKPQDGLKETAMGPSDSSGLKPQDPIYLDPLEIERHTENASRSPPPVSDDIDETTAKAARESATLLATKTNVLQLEDTSVLF
jgi:hypothetical protein